MDTPSPQLNSKLLQRYNFYLDVKNNPQLLDLLTKDIRSLGGKIESFLSKNVQYVVTTKPKKEWPQKPKEEEEIVSANHSKLNASLSRGGMLLAKTTQVNLHKSTVDVLEQARALKIKILQATDVMKICNDHISQIKDKNEKSQMAKVQQLSSPFLKILDNSNKYRANYKELAEWPEVNFSYQPELCPFFKKRKHSNSVPAISQQSFKSTTMMNQQGVRFNDKCTVLTTPTINGTGATQTIFKSTTTPQTGQTRKKMVFCEICHEDYDDFEKHMESPKHKEFMADTSNYVDLLKVVQMLPGFIVERSPPTSKSRHAMTGTKLVFVANSSLDMSLEPSPSSKSSPSLHSIGSVSKQFVALHNLLDEKNNGDLFNGHNLSN